MFRSEDTVFPTVPYLLDFPLRVRKDYYTVRSNRTTLLSSSSSPFMSKIAKASYIIIIIMSRTETFFTKLKTALQEARDCLIIHPNETREIIDLVVDGDVAEFSQTV